MPVQSPGNKVIGELLVLSRITAAYNGTMPALFIPAARKIFRQISCLHNTAVKRISGRFNMKSIARQKPFEEVLNLLDRFDRIYVVGCGTCATMAGL